MRTLPFLCFVLLLFSCGDKPRPLTQEEITTFTKKLESSVEKREAAFLNQVIDVDVFIRKMGVKGSMKSAIKSAMDTWRNFGDNVVNSISSKATYELVRQYEKDGQPHILMRLYDDGSMNYHDMELIRVNNECKVADIYIYTSGENLSKTIFNLYVGISVSMDKDDKSWMNNVQHIRTLINRQDFEGAKKLYDEIPVILKTNKMVQILNIQIAAGLSEEDYAAALTQYKTLSPNEPNIHLLMMDAYALRKEYDKMLSSVNALDSLLGGDPLLDFHRSLAYTHLKEEDKAKVYLERLVNKYPGFEDGVLELMVHYLDDHEYDKARKMEIAYRDDRDFDDTRLLLIMVAYPGYGEWLTLRSTID
jgi:hypothetical protein